MTKIPLWAYIAVMAGVTYLIRMSPFVLFRKRVRSPFFRSFLYYAPYAVLGAMTIPSIFYSAASVPAAACGFLVAALLAFRGKSLIVVAVAACFASYLAQLLMGLAGI